MGSEAMPAPTEAKEQSFLPHLVIGAGHASISQSHAATPVRLWVWGGWSEPQRGHLSININLLLNPGVP